MRMFERDVLRKSVCFTLRDGTDGLPETSANNDQHRLRNISEEPRPQKIEQDEM